MTNKLTLSLAVVAFLVAGVSFYLAVTLKPAAPVEPTGAIAGNQVTTPIFFQGGSMSYGNGFASTTTIPCIVPNSTGATTTIDDSGFTTILSTTTTTVIGEATTTVANEFAPTTTFTAFNTITIPANQTATGVWMPGTNDGILGPKQVLVFFYTTGTTLPTVAQQQSGFCAATYNNIGQTVQ